MKGSGLHELPPPEKRPFVQTRQPMIKSTGKGNPFSCAFLPGGAIDF